ncbi:unnamed protein product [Rotaria sordida]|uniref:Uncharacterized protein n=1 Tax=Rotaria sordida TaxID=392033 RepID=A0A818KBV1_9BILA|nr:unnamed protein product [Rotaria sordida]CAF3549264.1 unnamed protein product [Rotaria sordida]
MSHAGQRFSSLRMDIESVLKPFDDERQYLKKLRKSSAIEPILFRLFDLLNAEDYRLLFSSINRQKLDYKCLEIFSKLCMKRYLELDDIFFSENNFPNKIKSELNRKIIFQTYINYLKDNFKNFFSIHYFHAIIYEFEQLNNFKIEQISKQLNKNNEIIQKIFLSFNNNNHHYHQFNDDSIIHISSTPAQPIHLNYKPIHMIYIHTPVLIKNDHNLQLPSKGLINTFVSDLMNTKIVNILNETTNKTYDIPTKYLFFAQSCEKNIILPLKLRVLIIDSQTGQYRYGLISEEPGKNNNYRCLIFFIDDKINISANYYLSSDIHICLDQTFEYENDFLNCYFKSYPERMMLRAKEGTIVKIRNIFSTNKNLFIQAIVIQIDCSMMLIELSHTKQRIWIYRGSTLIEQMNNYYSTQNNIDNNSFSKHSARQHLSARKSNAPEIICLNDQMKTRNIRSAEQLIEEIRSVKRARISSKQDAQKSLLIQTETHTFPSDQQNNTSTTESSNHVITSVQLRSNHTNTNPKIIINPLFLELAGSFLLHYSKDFIPHYCSNKCVLYGEKYLNQLSRTMNPFLKPIACQWTILETVRIKKANDIRVKNSRPIIIYCSPCGRKLFNESQVDNYLHLTNSKLSIELFVFDSLVNIRQSYCSDGKIISSDISDGQENVPIIAVNEVNNDIPNTFTYRVERTPVKGVNMIVNEPTMTCCSCTDGCRNRIQCACWLRTLKYAELVGDERIKSMRAKHKSQAEILYQLGYGFRRLHKNVPGGIYECNNKCSCNKQTCSNRVVQNGIIAQLQLFKTVGRGWGVRTLHDLPVGTFISVYSGEIFTSEQADERGKLIGDEYQADLDFFENINNDSEDDEDEDENSDIHSELDNDEDEENKIPSSNNESRNLRSRELSNKKDRKKSSKSKLHKKNKTSTLNRTLLPDYDGVVYTLDAKLIGNIGRYFNHSCSPNIAVQNVFVDTHDIHFPWIGFFTTKTIRAGTELCWDYNYTVGEIAGRRMDCNCGSSECRRRVL